MDPEIKERLDAATRLSALIIDGDIPFDAGIAEFAVPSEVWASMASIGPDDADNRAALLGIAALWHSHVGDPAKAAGSACMLRFHWMHRLEDDGQNFSRCLGLGDSTIWLTIGLIRLGLLESAIEVVNTSISGLIQVGYPVAAENLKVLVAEACFLADKPEAAKAHLPSAEAIVAASAQQAALWGRPAPIHHVEARRSDVASNLLRLADAALERPEPVMTKWARERDEIAGRMEALAEDLGADGASIAAAMRQARRSNLTRVEALRVTSALLDAFVESTRTRVPGLKGISPELHAIAVNVATDERYCGTEDDLALLAVAARETETGPAGSWRDSCLWMIADLSERRGEFQRANEVLELLRSSLDAAREAASTPDVRAGLAASCAMLNARLASTRLRAGAGPWDVIQAIEWGKGRWLVEERAKTSFDAEGLRNAVRSARCHYLTMVLGEKSTCLVLVTADGEAVAHEAAVGRVDAELAVSRLLRDGFIGPGVGSWCAPLQPMFAWLPAPREGGVFCEGDVLLLAPDGPLHSLPLHALPCEDGKPLVPRLAVVRTHAAAVVSNTLLTDNPKPLGYLALCASTLREVGDGHRKKWFNDVVAVLRDVLGKGSVLEGTSADRRTLVEELHPEQVVHLWAHGDALPGSSFYRSSGILLADDGVLPVRGAAGFISGHLLSPERVFALGVQGQLAGSHVTIQACVSANARPNAQGDAIGLEWAFLRAGASSVMACHWHVSYRVAAAFSASFYSNWLGNNLPVSRAEAWRLAVREISGRSDLPEGSWAAMALTGDWR